jgi:hypothetical protein
MSENVSTTGRDNRRGELDVMGMLVVVGLIFFHTAQIFYIGPFYVKNEPPGMTALIFITFASLWGMPLMFLIAGMAVRYSMLKRTTGEFVRERIKRLLIPFVTGIVIIVPPQVYFGLKGIPSYAETYLQFYPRFFKIRLALNFPLYIKGALPDELFQLSYMYFVIYLLAFTMILLPLFNYLQKPKAKPLIERLVFFTRRWTIFLLAIPVAAVEAGLKTEFPGAWNRYAWVAFIVYGFLFASDKRFEEALRQHRKKAMVIGTILYIIYFGGLGGTFAIARVDWWSDYGPWGVLVRFAKGLTSWFWVVAIAGMVMNIGRKRAEGKRADKKAHEIKHLSSTGHADASEKPVFMRRLVVYAKEAQLPFYVLHQLPIVIIGFYVVKWEIHALLKYILICFGSLAATFALYDIFVRRTKITRFIFGMRTGKKTPQTDTSGKYL